MARGGPGSICGSPDGMWRSRTHLRESGWHVEVPDASAGVRLARGGPGRICGSPVGTWRSRTHLRGSGSAATGAEHFHLWDTW